MSDFEDDDDYRNVHHSQQAIYRPSEVAGVGAEMDERHRNGFASQEGEEEGEDIDDDSQQLEDYLEQHEHGEVGEEEDEQAALLDDDVYSGSEGEEEMGPDDAQAMLDHLRAVWSRLRPAFGDDDGDEEDDEDEEVNEEEEDGDEGGSEDSGEGEVNYNRTLPATHAYLGEDLDTVAGRTFLSSEQRIVLPIFPLNGIVLLPGETLPLRLFSDAYVGLIHRLLCKGSAAEGDVQGTLGVVNIPKNPRRSAPSSARPDEENITHRLAEVGTTAEIRSMAKQPSADGAVNALTVGRQRFRIVRAWMDNRQHIICAEVVIIPDEEPSCPPRGAFASMGGRYCSAPFVPPTSDDNGQAPVESRHPNPPGLRGKVMGALPSLPYGRRVFSVGWHPLWVYALYDARALAQRAKLMFDELILKQKQQPPTSTTSSSTSTSTSFSSSTADPVSYSFWLAANLPLDDKVRQELLEIHCAADRLRREMEIMKTYDTICCRRCGREIGGSKDVFCMSLEGPVSAYVNPSGFVHQTITLRKARGLTLEGSPSTDNSWFPGYAWTIAYCARCFAHMGWRFTAVSSDTQPVAFYGLSRAAITHVSAEASARPATTE